MADSAKTNILPVKHTTFVLQRLHEQRQKGTFCDATLIVEGEKFRVHRSFLAANSDYFLSLFTSAEEQQNFVLAGVPLQGFRVILDFIYTSTFVLNVANVHDVYKASSALDFKHVQAACEKVYRKIKQMERSHHAPRSDSSRRQHAADKSMADANARVRLHSPSSPTNDSSSSLRGPLNLDGTSALSETTFTSEQILSDGSSMSPTGSTSNEKQTDSRRSSCSPSGLENHNAISTQNSIEKSTSNNGIVPINPGHLKRKVKVEMEDRGTYRDKKISPKRCKVESIAHEAFPKEHVNLKDANQTDNLYHERLHQTNGMTPRRYSTDKCEEEESDVCPHRLQHHDDLEDAKPKEDRNDPVQQASVNVKPFVVKAHDVYKRTTSQIFSACKKCPPTHDNEEFVASSDQMNKTDYTCTFRASLGSSAVQSSNNELHCKENPQENAVTLSTWRLVTASEEPETCDIPPERQAKGHRNRRKMLKTNKVCATIE